MLDIIQRKPLNYCMYLCIVSSFSRSAPINQAICLSQKTYSQLIETNKSKIKSPKKRRYIEIPELVFNRANNSPPFKLANLLDTKRMKDFWKAAHTYTGWLLAYKALCPRRLIRGWQQWLRSQSSPRKGPSRIFPIQGRFNQEQQQEREINRAWAPYI